MSSLSNASSQIDSLSAPSAAEMREKSDDCRKPVLIKDIVSTWKASSAWTMESLRARFGPTPVRVRCSADGVFLEDTYEMMPFDVFVDLIQKPEPAQKKYYLQKFPLGGPFSVLKEDIIEPGYFDRSSLAATNLWFGPGGNVSPLHFDGADNLLCQVTGRKRVVLYPPEQRDCFYPFADGLRFRHLSQVDIDNPDLERFPRFRDAKPFEVMLNAGEMLLIPAQWWHQVYSLALSISVNFWYSVPPG